MPAETMVAAFEETSSSRHSTEGALELGQLAWLRLFTGVRDGSSSGP